MISLNLFVPDCVQAVSFYQKAYAAIITSKRIDLPKGERIIRIKIGSEHFTLMDENTAIGGFAPSTLGGTSVGIQMFVEPVLDWHEKNGKLSPIMISGVGKAMDYALNAGGILAVPSSTSKPIVTLNDGSEFCNIKDPYGYLWSICSQPENQQFLPLDKYFSVV